MKVDEIRERFLRFFEQRRHAIYPSDSLVPLNDPTLLFTGAGMNQFKDEFLGRVKGPRRIATCQKCLRTGDLEKVGKTPDHHTFFEMLGNFSFGDYFKKEAIVWGWEFLTEELGLNAEDLRVSVYKDDKEAYDIWKKVVKVPVERILKLGEEENFWPSNAATQGPNGPCGPCSEIFYDGAGEDVEIWNLVFTQFDRKDRGVFEPLPNKNIDTGMGLERIARVMQGKKTNFEIDSFKPIIDGIRELARRTSADMFKINAIADHIRAVTFAIADGVLPSNEERGYIIRKLIRKAFWYGRGIGIEAVFLYKLVPVVAKAMKRPYPELTAQREDIAQVVLAEEKRFMDTLQEGLDRLMEMINISRGSGILSGSNAFRLYDTYGFPLELTQEIALSEHMQVDLEGFERQMEQQRARSREGSKITKSIFDTISLEDRLGLGKTAFIEDRKMIETEILQIIVADKAREYIKNNERGSVFLKETNFYGEKGGQVGDTGVMIKKGSIAAEVTNTVDLAGVVRHEVVAKGHGLRRGDIIETRIDMDRRRDVMRNHTATHLLHSALRKVLGQHVKQAGSLVAPDRMRFDFTHFKALTEEEIARVEQIVNEEIVKNTSVDTRIMSFDEAKQKGAIALFGEKYGEVVRMVCIGDYSKELCGGTHVKLTGEIVVFRIVSESSIASGIRRIEALTGTQAQKKVKEESDIIRKAANELNTAPANIIKEIDILNNRLKKIEKELETARDKLSYSSTDKLLDDAREINGYKIIIAEVKNADAFFLRKSADVIKANIKSGIYVLLSEKGDKLSMVVGMPRPIKDIDAIRILNDIGEGFGIRGGGRPDFAQAGGCSSGIDIKKVLKKAEGVINDIVR